MTSIPPGKLIQAYPYRIVCSNQMNVAFSFMNVLYVLNSEGQLIGKWGMGTLLQEISGKDFSCPNKLTETTTIGDVTVETSMINSQMEQPRVSALVSSDEGNVFVAASKTMLLWITPDAKIAHAMEVPMGKRNSHGDSGTITRVEVLGNGGAAIAEVCVSGYVTIKNGKVLGILEMDTRSKVWDIRRRDGIFAIASMTEPTIQFYNFEMQLIDTLSVGSPLRSLEFSEDGRFLFTHGDNADVYLISE